MALATAFCASKFWNPCKERLTFVGPFCVTLSCFFILNPHISMCDTPVVSTGPQGIVSSPAFVMHLCFCEKDKQSTLLLIDPSIAGSPTSLSLLRI